MEDGSIPVTDKQNTKEKKKFGETSVARHVAEARHNVSDLRWLIIEEVYGNNRTQVNLHLLQRET